MLEFLNAGPEVIHAALPSLRRYAEIFDDVALRPSIQRTHDQLTGWLARLQELRHAGKEPAHFVDLMLGLMTPGQLNEWDLKQGNGRGLTAMVRTRPAIGRRAILAELCRRIDAEPELPGGRYDPRYPLLGFYSMTSRWTPTSKNGCFDGWNAVNSFHIPRSARCW